ncbi:hypothetical protein VTI74DRAFT_5756 [Chaetomium olivicolor]
MELNICLPNDDPTERRRRQNRLAQRKFRLKKAADSANSNASSRSPQTPASVQQQRVACEDDAAAPNFLISPMIPTMGNDYSASVLNGNGPDISCGFEDIGFGGFEAVMLGGSGPVPTDVCPPIAQPPFLQDFNFTSSTRGSETSPSTSKSVDHIGLPHAAGGGADITTLCPPGMPQEMDGEVPFHAISPTGRSQQPRLPPPCDQPLYASRLEESLTVLSTASPHAALDGWVGTLHIAAQRGNHAMVRMLLQLGDVDCNERDSDGRTPLMCAVIEGHEDIAKLLLASGARPGEVDRDRRSALHYAVLYRREGALRMLLERREPGLGVDDYDIAGWTPIHMAIDRNFTAGLQLLLQNGANSQSKARKCPFARKQDGGAQ